MPKWLPYGIVGAVGVLIIGMLLVSAGGGAGVGFGQGGVPPTETSPLSVTMVMSPSGQIQAGDSVTAMVTVSGGNASEVVVLVDGQRMAATTQPPYSLEFAVDAAGSHTVVAEVTDLNGSVWKSSPASLDVENSPEVAITEVIDLWVESYKGADLSTHMDCYGPTIAPYFKKSSRSNASVKQDKSGSFNTTNYSKREMSVSNLVVTMTGTDSAEAVFDKAWDFVSSSRFAGEEQQRLLFRRIGGEWKIVGEIELEIYWVTRK